MKHKFGCSFCVWDGEELLLPAVRRMRLLADKIVLVYSNTSNYGEANPGLRTVIDQIEREGLADEIVQFFPHVAPDRQVPVGHRKSPHENELAMRNLGLERCQDCEVFSVFDCDELYVDSQFLTALDAFIAGGYDSSCCNMQTYYKFSNIRITPPEQYFVSLFYRNNGRRFMLNEKWPVLVDPTRRMTPGKLLVFDRTTIEMHHFSYCRTDIRRKLRNSSAKTNFAARIEEIASWHDSWTTGKQALLAGKEKRLYNTEHVDLSFPELDLFR